MAQRASAYVAVERRNQLSKLCWYAAGSPEDLSRIGKDPNYLIA